MYRLAPRCYDPARSHLPEGDFRMANNISQDKRNRQNETRRAANKAVRSELKTRARTALEAAQEGDAARAAEALKMAQKRIDMATSKGVLHKNTAARRKSRLDRRVRELLAG